MASEPSHRQAVKSASLLAAFQLVAMALPLLTLPVMARALGVELFGQIMLAQFMVFFAVTFVDAGLNTESQRRTVMAATAVARAQCLLDNLLARSVLAGALTPGVLLLGYLTPGLPMWMIGVALLHLLGTLAFPQWWFVAREQGLLMGLASAGGRLLAAIPILLWVRTPADAPLALVSMCLGTLLSGLMLLPLLWRDVGRLGRRLDLGGGWAYLRQMRSMILPGFAASSAQSLPGVTLGYIAGSAQVGLFSAADRLTRAAAHIGTIATQSLLNVAARWHRAAGAPGVPHRLVFWVGGLCATCVLVIAMLSPWGIALLYGPAFTASVPVLQALGGWLGLYLFRNACVVMWLTSRGHLSVNARLQWQEGLSVAMLCVAGGAWAGALGVSLGLVLAELGLLLRLACLLREFRVVKEQGS